MISIQPVFLEKGCAIGLRVDYPLTTLISLTVPGVGYIMCGLLHTQALDELHPERKIIAARITGVNNIEDLLASQVQEATQKAVAIGIKQGMTGREVLNLMFEYGQDMNLSKKRGDSNDWF